MEKVKNEEFNADKMIKFYNVTEKNRGLFFLQVDWLLENAVHPLDREYADNLMDLWNVYMPDYKFDKIVLDYSQKYFPVLRFIHNGEISKFYSVWMMQECGIKNYVKYCISQGCDNRVELIGECFDLFKDITDRTKLYDSINKTIEHYFVNGEIEQSGITFLRRFQDDTSQPYVDIVERLGSICEQRNARSNLLKTLGVGGEESAQVCTLINVMLCRLAMADGGEKRFSDVLKETWNKTVIGLPYTDKIYAFVEKYEDAYMKAACFGIKNIGDMRLIRQLYKDSVVLCAVLQALESGNQYSIKDVQDFYMRDDVHFVKGIFFEEDFERMKDGFNPDILLKYKDEILSFHDALIEKIGSQDNSSTGTYGTVRGRMNSASEVEHAVLNEKDRRIEELQERISELEEKADNAEKEVLSQFISLLDSKKYGHVLGKLYRMAYVDKTVKTEDIQRILKNLFEIMNISGIDVYGDLEKEVAPEDIGRGKYRVEYKITKEARVKYPGYKIGNSVILHPLAEEV